MIITVILCFWKANRQVLRLGYCKFRGALTLNSSRLSPGNGLGTAWYWALSSGIMRCFRDLFCGILSIGMFY